MSAHVNHLISSKISLLRQLSEYVSTDTQKMFYQGYILPFLDYGSITLDSASGANTERHLKLQKCETIIILDADFNEPSTLMLQELGWPPVGSRINYNKAILTYKALNNMTPEYITNLLKPMSQAHSLNLRSAANGALYIPKARTTLYTRLFSYSVPRLWNSLPPTTVKTFL